MNTYVLDTSVVLQWIHQKHELHPKQAQKIFEDLQSGKINILIPNLLTVELLNALLIGKKTSTEEANLAVKEIFESTLTIVEVTLPLLFETSVLMREYSLTSYDAYFLALAQTEGCQLISDDQKAHGKITDGTVLMLEDY
ncbi:type II toxin-antitoxin system VapC family toxin [Candidatus Daviesbacteria bacterium]|nr:type II toxin-antitoxin system VapC family toxin [Candidatus Daviesbacteria bacterium]